MDVQNLFIIVVALMPLVVPFMMPGLEPGIWALAKPLMVLILIPMILGILIRIDSTRVADTRKKTPF